MRRSNVAPLDDENEDGVAVGAMGSAARGSPATAESQGRRAQGELPCSEQGHKQANNRSGSRQAGQHAGLFPSVPSSPPPPPANCAPAAVAVPSGDGVDGCDDGEDDAVEG